MWTLPWDPIVTKVQGQRGCNVGQKAIVQNDDIHARLKYVKQGFQFFNESIGKEQLELFEQCRSYWFGALSDQSLFLLWKETKCQFSRHNNKLTVEQTGPNDSTLEEEESISHGQSSPVMVEVNENIAIPGPSSTLAIPRPSSSVVIAGPSSSVDIPAPSTPVVIPSQSCLVAISRHSSPISIPLPFQGYPLP